MYDLIREYNMLTALLIVLVLYVLSNYHSKSLRQSVFIGSQFIDSQVTVHFVNVGLEK